MEITSFESLLAVAHSQSEPQRLLFVFAGSGLPDHATAEQRGQFEAGEGGELTPLMCVDKSVDELHGFDALVAEAALAGPSWAIVFTAALSGRDGHPPGSDDARAPLQHMVDSIKAGRLEGMLPFDRRGDPVSFV